MSLVLSSPASSRTPPRRSVLSSITLLSIVVAGAAVLFCCLHHAPPAADQQQQLMVMAFQPSTTTTTRRTTTCSSSSLLMWSSTRNNHSSRMATTATSCSTRNTSMRMMMGNGSPSRPHHHQHQTGRSSSMNAARHSSTMGNRSKKQIMIPFVRSLHQRFVTRKHQKSTTKDEEGSALITAAAASSDVADNTADDKDDGKFSYVKFAKTYPFINNLIIASIKTGGADLMAQTVINGVPILNVDWPRVLLFTVFGATYLGAFQYFYQVLVFKKLFDVDRFTTQSWSAKIRDVNGLLALAAQTFLDMIILTVIYLPLFYVFKSAVFGGTFNVVSWFTNGISSFMKNFAKDEIDLLMVWIPADLLCFSVPLYLRLPVRHAVSFLWTAYLSFARGSR